MCSMVRWTEVRTTSRGKCLVARNFIPKGRLLLKEKYTSGVNLDILNPSAKPFPGLTGREKSILSMMNPSTVLISVLTIRFIESIMQNNVNLESSLCSQVTPERKRSYQSIATCVYYYFHKEIAHSVCIEFVDKVSRNAFTIMNYEMHPIGLAIYDSASGFNHSCYPNAWQTFDQSTGTLSIYSSRDIALGEEICIAYIDIGQPMPMRRADLWDKHGFICMCPRCTVNDVDDVWSCPHKKVRSSPPPPLPL
jgi:hypothetical protein